MVKGILFNTDMVRAILDGRKTVTRRIVKPQPQGCFEVHEEPLFIYDADDGLGRRNPPYQSWDILYVRETWQEDTIFSDERRYFYRADEVDCMVGEIDWRPSIHMPKEAARIWLKVTDVRVERLQEITEDGAEKEGAKAYGLPNCSGTSARIAFAEIWDGTVKQKEYEWPSNPWVWVIEFERCEKPELCLS